MSAALEVRLRDRRTGEAISASLHEALNAEEIRSGIAGWRPLIEARIQEWIAKGIPRSQWPQHSHWNWDRKVARYFGLLAYQFLGIVCEGEMQGIMLVATEGQACRLPEQAGKPLVYVDFVATAPWNDPDFTDAPRFGLVGSVLIAAAVQLSWECGFHGRLGLHALPQAEGFYRDSCGMTDLGVDVVVENLRYFEMTPEQADFYLNR